MGEFPQQKMAINAVGGAVQALVALVLALNLGIPAAAQSFANEFSSEQAQEGEATLNSMEALERMVSASNAQNFSAMRDAYFSFDDVEPVAWTLRNLSTEQSAAEDTMQLFSGFTELYSSDTWLDALARKVLVNSTFVNDNPTLASSAAPRIAQSILAVHILTKLNETSVTLQSGDGDASEPLLQAAATYYGPAGEYSPHGLSVAMDDLFGSNNAEALLSSMKELLASIDAGNASDSELLDALDNAGHLLFVPYFQATLNSTTAIDPEVEPTNVSENGIATEWGKAYATWRAISGFVYQVDEPNALAIERQLSYDNYLNQDEPTAEGAFCTMRGTIQNNSESLDVSPESIGFLDTVPDDACGGNVTQNRTRPGEESAGASSKLIYTFIAACFLLLVA